MEYLGVADGEYTAEYVVNRSRFICTVTRAADVEAGFEFVQKIRRRYPDATHNPYALIGTPESGTFRFSDDGEPQGTTGAPIMNAVRMQSLYCTAVVVTRYFGGIKLGAGGLVQAYSTATAMGLAAAEIVRYRLSAVYTLEIGYSEYKGLEQVLRAAEAKVLDTEYSDSVKVTFSVPQEAEDNLKRAIMALTSGQAERLTEIERKYITYKR